MWVSEKLLDRNVLLKPIQNVFFSTNFESLYKLKEQLMVKMDRIGRKKIRFQAIVQKQFWNIVEKKRKEACQKIVDNLKKNVL